ncbi:hypothetical protein BA177_06720 [Woeseia oceani]|uniref:Uncharacterized protein n=2 Tax=Woeseia oceani TaxID=1548547 RepID=A0A193LEI5_9GAMM|nr:hypothetical protein BA177_06720 [Woeseia oceani]
MVVKLQRCDIPLTDQDSLRRFGATGRATAIAGTLLVSSATAAPGRQPGIDSVRAPGLGMPALLIAGAQPRAFCIGHSGNQATGARA